MLPGVVGYKELQKYVEFSFQVKIGSLLFYFRIQFHYQSAGLYEHYGL